MRIPQLIPVRPEGDPSSSSAAQLRELIPPARVYDDPAFDFLDRDPYMMYRKHIQVEAEEDAARGSQEPEPGLELDEPDSEDEPALPRPNAPYTSFSDGDHISTILILSTATTSAVDMAMFACLRAS